MILHFQPTSILGVTSLITKVYAFLKLLFSGIHCRLLSLLQARFSFLLVLKETPTHEACKQKSYDISLILLDLRL